MLETLTVDEFWLTVVAARLAGVVAKSVGLFPPEPVEDEVMLVVRGRWARGYESDTSGARERNWEAGAVMAGTDCSAVRMRNWFWLGEDMLCIWFVYRCALLQVVGASVYYHGGIKVVSTQNLSDKG